MSPQGTRCLRFFVMEASCRSLSSLAVSLVGSSAVLLSGCWGSNPIAASIVCGNSRRPNRFLTRDIRPAGLLQAMIKPGNSCGVINQPDKEPSHVSCDHHCVCRFWIHHQPSDRQGVWTALTQEDDVMSLSHIYEKVIQGDRIACNSIDADTMDRLIQWACDHKVLWKLRDALCNLMPVQ